VRAIKIAPSHIQPYAPAGDEPPANATQKEQRDAHDKPAEPYANVGERRRRGAGANDARSEVRILEEPQRHTQNPRDNAEPREEYRKTDCASQAVALRTNYHRPLSLLLRAKRAQRFERA
jgi:hypothetical protein